MTPVGLALSGVSLASFYLFGWWLWRVTDCPICRFEPIYMSKRWTHPPVIVVRGKL